MKGTLTAWRTLRHVRAGHRRARSHSRTQAKHACRRAGETRALAARQPRQVALTATCAAYAPFARPPRARLGVAGPASSAPRSLRAGACSRPSGAAAPPQDHATRHVAPASVVRSRGRCVVSQCALGAIAAQVANPRRKANAPLEAATRGSQRRARRRTPSRRAAAKPAAAMMSWCVAARDQLRRACKYSGDVTPKSCQKTSSSCVLRLPFALARRLACCAAGVRVATCSAHSALAAAAMATGQLNVTGACPQRTGAGSAHAPDAHPLPWSRSSWRARPARLSHVRCVAPRVALRRAGGGN